jgi:subtilisin family serine protease
MKPNDKQKTMRSFIWIFTLALIILSFPPAFGFSCKENNLSFDSDSILLEIKNNKSYLKDSSYLKSYLQKKFPNTKFTLEPLLDSSEDPKLSRSLGLEKIYRLSIVDSSDAKTECQNIKKVFEFLKKNKFIKEVSLDYEMEINSTNDFFYNTNGTYWSLRPLDEMFFVKNYGLENIWQISTGSGVVVAVIDTGVDYNHPDLWKNIWVNPKRASDRNLDGVIDLDDIDTNGNKRIESTELTKNLIGYNFVNKNKDPQDRRNGHGTLMAGIISASRNNELGTVGVAPNAKIMVIKALNDNGKGKFSDIAKAIIYAADMKANIINSSWGCNCALPTILKKAYSYAYKKGLVIVSAGGNNGSGKNNYSPANLKQTIGVASVDHEGLLSNFSNYGAGIDISAPGENILSTLAQGALGFKNPETKMGKDSNFDYYYYSGTSLSAAYISGVCALVLAKNPQLKNFEVKNLLKTSVEPLSGYSFGRINPVKLFD